MNISAISLNSGLMQKNQKSMNFGTTRGQLAVKLFLKDKELKMQEDVVNSLSGIVKTQKEKGLKIDEMFVNFVNERKANLEKLRNSYLKAEDEYYSMAGDTPDYLGDLKKSLRCMA